MKNILVPTDFSLCASKAVNQAIYIAQKTKASVCFFHSINSSVDWVNFKSSVPSSKTVSFESQLKLFPELKKQINEARNKLELLKREAERKNINASYEIAFNIAHSDIIAFATKKKSDLIIMGTTGASGLKGVLVGSNTGKIIRMSTIPVLTVGLNCKPEPIKSIVYVSDFEEEKINKNISLIKNYSSLLKAELSLLYINTPTFFESTKYSNQKMKNIILKNDLRKTPFAVYNDFTVEEGVSNYTQSNSSNLVAISTHNRKGLSRLFFDNITEVLMGKLDKPLIIIPKK